MQGFHVDSAETHHHQGAELVVVHQAQHHLDARIPQHGRYQRLRSQSLGQVGIGCKELVGIADAQDDTVAVGFMQDAGLRGL